jgi:hypothetical protein
VYCTLVGVHIEGFCVDAVAALHVCSTCLLLWVYKPCQSCLLLHLLWLFPSAGLQQAVQGFHDAAVTAAVMLLLLSCCRQCVHG